MSGSVYDLSTGVGLRPTLEFMFDPSHASKSRARLFFQLSDAELEDLLTRSIRFEHEAERTATAVQATLLPMGLNDHLRRIRVELEEELKPGWHHVIASEELDEVFEFSFRRSLEPELRRSMRINTESMPLIKEIAALLDPDGVTKIILTFSEEVGAPPGSRFQDLITVSTPAGATITCSDDGEHLMGRLFRAWLLRCEELPSTFIVKGDATISSASGVMVRQLDSEHPGFEVQYVLGPAPWRQE